MPVKSEKQRRFMEGIAHGMKPYGGTGPSPEVAKEMLGYSDKKGSTKKKKKKKKRSVVEQAAKGYKREGGLWNKIKDKIMKVKEASKPEK